MFTGIVEELGEVTGRDGLADAARLTIRGPRTGDFQIPEGSRWGLAIGLSQAVVSRTLESCDWDAIRKSGDQGPETLRKWLEFHLAGSNDPEYRTSGVSPAMQDAWSAASAAPSLASSNRPL